MTSTTRQNTLLAAEDWHKIYQSFRNADFTSYDFDNLRRTMIDYIRTNYPEDFNDYIESSEYLALIDLIAFVGQSIAYRVDLNARDNFLELAERRESILRLANLVGYNPKRNMSANGLLKVTSVTTTEIVLDSNGRNLANQTILWNDSANTNWYDQFFKIINAAFPSGQQFGNPADSATIYGIPTQQYRFNSNIGAVPVFAFTETIGGQPMSFEVTSTTFNGQSYVYEEPPSVKNNLACIFRDDGYGYGSPTNGFFLNFTQGTLTQGTFTISQPTSNESVDIAANNINNTDVWLYGLDVNGNESTLWTQVPALQGNNIIYNSLKKNIKNIFQVVTQANDAVALQFSDGIFGNLPLGTFKVYYRVSNGLSYIINARDIRNVSISIPYLSASNQQQTLTLNLSLASSVVNATTSESNASIKTNAPQTYYTQDRMITGEDYNINPLAASTQVVKVKAINRTSSGISRYFDLIDPTGKYSSTTLFGTDGALYTEYYLNEFLFSFVTQTDIQGIIYNDIFNILADTNLKNFFYSNFKINNTSPSVWTTVTSDSNSTTGYFLSTIANLPAKIGTNSTSTLYYAQIGSLVKFTAPAGTYFDTTNYNSITTIPNSGLPDNATQVLWSEIVGVVGDGTTTKTVTGLGPVTLNKKIPTNAIVSAIIPAWATVIDSYTVNTIINLIASYQTFGLTFNTYSQSWQIIIDTNLDSNDAFSLNFQGNNANKQLDASWLLLFSTDKISYTVKIREQRYIFESANQINFYFDGSKKIYNNVSNTVVKDGITVLNINKQPFSTNSFTIDQPWQIISEYIGIDGFVDNTKLVVGFNQTDSNQGVDNPETFYNIVYGGSPVEPTYILQQKYSVTDGQEDYQYVANTGQVIIITTNNPLQSLTSYTDGQYFYYPDSDTTFKLHLATATLNPTLDYKVFVGRDNLKFQYIHNADYESRVDPGASNIVDIYVLTQNYDTQFRQWVAGAIQTEPLPPGTDELYDLLSPNLNLIKSISDDIVYHPVTYVQLFGQTAASELQASFQVIINPEQVVSANDVKSRIITAINEFFSVNNWDFGDTFYFTELSTYVMNKLSPDITMFIIVPRQGTSNFGSLFEITCNGDQLFISTATVNDIEIVTGITATGIKAIPTQATMSTTASSQIILSTAYGSLNG